jgi:hypothetical protein
MLLSDIEAVSRPVDQGVSFGCLKEPKLISKNRELVQKLVSPVTALKRPCVTSSAIAPALLYLLNPFSRVPRFMKPIRSCKDTALPYNESYANSC